MKLLRLLALAFPLALAACVTVPPPTVSPEEVASYKLTGVEVQGVEVVGSWPAQEEAYLASGKADPAIAKRLPNEQAWNFPPVREQFQAALQQRFSAAFAEKIAPILQGARSVRAIIRLKQFDVPGGARRALIDPNAKMRATIDIVDAKGDKILLSYAGLPKQKDIGGGFIIGGGPIHGIVTAALAGAMQKDEAGAELISAYVDDYRSWLVAR
jgi:hypothetical protein